MTRKNRLLILADDLTGALDTGVQFAKKGIEVEVFPTPGAAESFVKEPAGFSGEGSAVIPAAKPASGSPAVQVINTNSRHSAPKEARTVVAALARSFGTYSFFYKKTDSCLRGNIGAELEALMEAAESALLPFVPAYPELERITRKGCQFLHGKPLHQSSMAEDPFNPVTESFIPGIINRQSSIPVRLVERNSEIPNPLAAREILVFDSETREDLREIARRLWKRGLLRVSAGCAGFAEALMEVLPLEKSEEEPPAKPVQSLPVLVVSGSVHPVSIEQVETARSQGISCFALAEEKLIQSGWPASPEAETTAAACAQSLWEKGAAILGTEASLGKTPAPPRGNASEILPESLGTMVRKIIEKAGPLHLAVFGGDTLVGVMKILGYNRLRPLKEILPGIVLARAAGQREGGQVLTKAGAFGNKDLISVINAYLKKGSL